MCKVTKCMHVPKSKTKIKIWITSGIVVSIRYNDELFNKLKKQPFNSDLKNKFHRPQYISVVVSKTCLLLF